MTSVKQVKQNTGFRIFLLLVFLQYCFTALDRPTAPLSIIYGGFLD